MLNKKVAIKEYFPREFAIREGTLTVVAVSNKSDSDNYSWGLKKFLEEARVLASFDHSNIARVRRYFEANGTAYLVMDYCEGTPLDKLIDDGGPLSQETLSKLLYPILDALEHMHDAHLLHRDIKPANIFIKRDGTPVLLDFGAARQEVASHSKSVTSLVTPGYGALEQYSTHGEQGPSTDIYGFAATLYKAVTGDKPQDATSRMIDDKMSPASQRSAGKYDSRLLTAIDKAMSVKPADRPQNIAEWREMISSSNTNSNNTNSKESDRTVLIKTSTSSQGKSKAPLYIISFCVISIFFGGIYYLFAGSKSDGVADTVSTPKKIEKKSRLQNHNLLRLNLKKKMLLPHNAITKVTNLHGVIATQKFRFLKRAMKQASLITKGNS